MAAATKASWIGVFADREGIRLSDSRYTDSMSIAMPAMSDTRRLSIPKCVRQTHDHDWPIRN